MIDKMEGGKENRQMFPPPCPCLHSCCVTVGQSKAKAAVGASALVSSTRAVQWVSWGDGVSHGHQVRAWLPGSCWATTWQNLSATSWPKGGEARAEGPVDHEFISSCFRHWVLRGSPLDKGRFPVRTIECQEPAWHTAPEMRSVGAGGTVHLQTAPCTLSWLPVRRPLLEPDALSGALGMGRCRMTLLCEVNAGLSWGQLGTLCKLGLICLLTKAIVH